MSNASRLYYYRSEGQENGPVTAAKLLELFETHMLTAFDEARGDRETQWQPIQEAVAGILEARKAGGGAQPRSATKPVNPARTAAGTGTSGEGGVELDVSAPVARVQPNALVEQRGAKAPKAPGAISDEDLAQSIAYANAEVRRSVMIRAAVGLTLLTMVAAAALHYSTSLRANTPAFDVPLRVETELLLEAGEAKMQSSRGSWQGSGGFNLKRARVVTFERDGSASVVNEEDAVRLKAQLVGGPDQNDLKFGALRGRTLTFTPAEPTWVAALHEATATPAQAARLEAMAVDNRALFPERRMWPWPWQSWLVEQPQACAVLSLELEDCKAAVRMKLVGFSECEGQRCARLTFDGEWKGLVEGDRVMLKMTGEILRSAEFGIDVSIIGQGQLSVHRTVAGPTSTAEFTLAGPVTYTQTTLPAQ